MVAGVWLVVCLVEPVGRFECICGFWVVIWAFACPVVGFVGWYNIHFECLDLPILGWCGVWFGMGFVILRFRLGDYGSGGMTCLGCRLYYGWWVGWVW